TLKFGFLWERLDYNGFGRQTIAGSINGNRLMTSIPGNNNLSTGGGNGFASFLLGQAFSRATMTDNYALSPRPRYPWDAQDDIPLTSRLTLNVGLRYEFNPPPRAGDDGLSDFSPTKPNPAAGGIPGALIFAGYGPGRENAHSITPGWYGGIGPRLGAALSINNTTDVRADASA